MALVRQYTGGKVHTLVPHAPFIVPLRQQQKMSEETDEPERTVLALGRPLHITDLSRVLVERILSFCDGTTIFRYVNTQLPVHRSKIFVHGSL